MSLLSNENLFLLPDFEALHNFETLNSQVEAKSEVEEKIHQSVRSLFKERKRHLPGCPIAFLSCFEKNGSVDTLLKRSFQILLSVNDDTGKALMLYTDEVP